MLAQRQAANNCPRRWVNCRINLPSDRAVCGQFAKAYLVRVIFVQNDRDDKRSVVVELVMPVQQVCSCRASRLLRVSAGVIGMPFPGGADDGVDLGVLGTPA